MTLKDLLDINLTKPAICLIFLALLFSCREKNASSPVLEIDLVKIDSFVVQRDTRFRILDHEAASGNYLGYDPITKSFLIIDRQGKIVQEVSRIGEGPNEYNSNLSTAAFNKVGGGVFLQSPNELLWYDENWDIKKRWKYAPNFGVTVYSGPRFTTSYYFKEDKESPLVFTAFFPGIKIPFAEILSISRNGGIVEVFESSKDSLAWKLPIDFGLHSPHSPTDKEFDLAQVNYLDTENKVLLLTFDNSLVVGVHDMNADFELVRKFTLPKDDLVDKGRGKTVKLFPAFDQGLLLLRYSGMSELELARRKEANSTYSPVQDAQLYRFYYLNKDKSVFKELPFPDGIEPNSELIMLGSGKILMREKDREDAEMNHSSYSIYEIRMKEM